MSIYDRLYDVRNYTGMYAERFRDLSAKLSPGGAPGKAQYTGSTNQGTDMKFDSVSDFLRPGFRSRTRISDNGRRVPEATTWSPRGMDPIPIPDHPLDTPGKLQYLFNFYCMYGRTGLQRIKTLGEFQYMRFIKHCPGLLCNDKRLMRSAGGGEVLDQTEADLIFVRAKGKCENRLSFDTFMDALQMMAVKKFPIDDAKTALTYLLAKHVLRNENLVKIGQGADSALDVEATYTIADAPPTGSAPAIADAAASSFGPPTNAIEVEAALQREQKRLVDEVFGPDEGVRKFNEILEDPEAYRADKRPYVVRILALCDASRRFAEEEAAAMAAAAGGGADVARIVAQTQERDESHRRNLAVVTQQLAQSELQRETLKKSLSRSLEEQARAGSERRALSEQLNETRAALAAMQTQLAQQGGGGRGGYAPPSPPSSRSPLRAGASVHIDRDSNIVISPGGARVTAHGATQQAAAATPLPGGRAEAAARRGERSFMYRYIPRESCSQFDSLPLTSLTISEPAAPLTVRNVRTIAGNGNFIFCLGALSGTGGFLAGSGDHTIYERRADGDLALRPTLKGHASEVYCIIVLPDGTIVSGSSDSTICVWNKNAGNGAWKMADQLLKHSGAVCVSVALCSALAAHHPLSSRPSPFSRSLPLLHVCFLFASPRSSPPPPRPVTASRHCQVRPGKSSRAQSARGRAARRSAARSRAAARTGQCSCGRTPRTERGARLRSSSSLDTTAACTASRRFAMGLS
jgi:hypothetical protein